MTDFKLYLKSPTVLVGAFTVKELPFDEVINGCNAVFNSYVKVYSPIPSDPVNKTPGAVLFLQTAVDPEILASGIGFTIKSAELEYTGQEAKDSFTFNRYLYPFNPVLFEIHKVPVVSPL
jgi:hypothetical protein